MYILALETSCDETAAALYSTKTGLVSHFLFSQIELQKAFGGVIPEIASRSHLEKITSIVQTVLVQSGHKLSEIDIFAVTSKPGLAGSLLIGLCFTKALAFACKKPLIGVNHLEGHAFSTFLENPEIPFPHVCLTASGGHTSLYLIEDFGNYTLLGTTRDDAAGEAFDKIAKLLELGYPGGPIIERYAARADFKDFFNYPRPYLTDLDFSFSGLKTAVLYSLIESGAYDRTEKKLIDTSQKLKEQVASSFLVCVGDIFEKKLAQAAALHKNIQAFTFVGGVACNAYLRKRLTVFAAKQGKKIYWPSPQFCTDNAAMIAFVAAYKAQKEEYAALSLDIF
jgi:N6-L-threonylcarbamoyladenine synthase